MTSTAANRRRAAAFAATRWATTMEERARREEARAERWGGTRNSDAHDARREADAAWEAARSACASAAWAEREASRKAA